MKNGMSVAANGIDFTNMVFSNKSGNIIGKLFSIFKIQAFELFFGKMDSLLQFLFPKRRIGNGLTFFNFKLPLSLNKFEIDFAEVYPIEGSSAHDTDNMIAAFFQVFLLFHN